MLRGRQRRDLGLLFVFPFGSNGLRLLRLWGKETVKCLSYSLRDEEGFEMLVHPQGPGGNNDYMRN